jgi:hypothetical protein
VRPYAAVLHADVLDGLVLKNLERDSIARRFMLVRHLRKNRKMAKPHSKKKRTSGTLRKTALKHQPSRNDPPHYAHPAGYRVGGAALATLKEILDPACPTLSLEELTEQQRNDMIIARFRLKPENYTISMIGRGVINKARAIAEIEAGSPVGRTLIEIEQLLITAFATEKQGAH